MTCRAQEALKAVLASTEVNQNRTGVSEYVVLDPSLPLALLIKIDLFVYTKTSSMNEWRADLDGEAADLLRQLQYNPNPNLQKQYDDVQKRIRTWIADHRGYHLNWVYEQELKGVKIHQCSMNYGPTHPCSYLMYLDEGHLIFRRDHQDNYTSYPFWLEHLLVEEPVNYLGTVWFSAKELGVEPSLIDRLYHLQTRYIQTAALKDEEVEEMDGIHRDLQLKLTEKSTKESA